MDNIEQKQVEVKNTIQAVQEFNKKNPKDKEALKWKQEFVEAQKLVVEKDIEDRLSGITREFYSTEYSAIEDDIQDENSDDYVPIHVYAMKPIACHPASVVSMQKGPAVLNERQKEFCQFMRQRVVVVMSHYANDRDLFTKTVSPIAFQLNMLPDKNVLEKWILPSHKPISIPLYILRHFGAMSTCKKLAQVSMRDRAPEEIQSDPELLSSSFVFQQVVNVTGTDSYVRFVRLSQIKKKLKLIQDSVD